MLVMRKGWLFSGMLVIFLALVIGQSIEVHTFGRTIIDDGYYYLGYGWSIANGQGVTFDGLVKTNGVQPLWALVVALLALAAPDREALVYLMLMTAATFALLSIYNIHRILKDTVSDAARWFMLLIYTAFVINPQLSLTGMETSINVFMLTTTLAVLWRLPPPPVLATRHLMFGGTLIGLVTLSRIDNLLITPLLALVVLWRTGLWGALWQERDYKPVLHVIIRLALPALLIFGSYLIFNQIVFERWLPISGDVKAAQEVMRRAPTGGQFTLSHVWHTTQQAAQHYVILLNHYASLLLATYDYRITLMVRTIVSLTVVVGVLTLVVRLLRPRHPRLVTRLPVLSLPDVVLLLVVITGIFAHTWMMFFRLGVSQAVPLNWYYVPEYVAVTILIALSVNALLRTMPLDRRLMGAFYVGLGLLMVVGTTTYLTELQPKPLVSPLNTHYHAALWANENLPSDAVGGAFNAGVIGYFTDLRVINLDGLMNNDDILRVTKGETTIWDYVQQQSLDYLMDYQSTAWLPQQTDFRGVPHERLELLYSDDFVNWGAQPATYLIFRLLPA